LYNKALKDIKQDKHWRFSKWRQYQPYSSSGAAHGHLDTWSDSP